MAGGKAPKAHIEGTEKSGQAVAQEQGKASGKAPKPTASKPSYEVRLEEQPGDTEQAAVGDEVGREDETTGGHQASGPLKGASDWLSRTFPGSEHAALGGMAGLLVALAVFFVGFWETLFVVLLMVVGVALGQFLDGDPKIVNFIRRFLAEGRGN